MHGGLLYEKNPRDVFDYLRTERMTLVKDEMTLDKSETTYDEAKRPMMEKK